MDKTPIVHRLRWLFAFCLLFISAFMITFCGLLQSSIQSNENDSVLISKSGQQRMLSQKAIVLASELVHASNSAERNSAWKKLVNLRHEMASIHQYLVHYELSKGSKISKIEQNLYFTNKFSLSAQIPDFLREVDQLTHAPAGKLNPNNANYLTLLEMNKRETLQETLNRIVLEYQAESNRHITDIVNFHRLMSALFSTALIGLLGFVFRYVESKITRYVTDLKETNTELLEENRKRE